MRKEGMPLSLLSPRYYYSFHMLLNVKKTEKEEGEYVYRE